MLCYNTLALFSIRAVSSVKVFKGGLLENKVKILLVLVILIFDEPLLSSHLPLPREWPLNPLQGVQFLFFPLFSYFLNLFLFSPILNLKPPIFPIFLAGEAKICNKIEKGIIFVCVFE